MKQLTVFILTSFCLSIFTLASAQVVDTVYIGQQATYYIGPEQEGVQYAWSTSGGIVMTQNNGAEASVKWGEKIGLYDLLMIQTSKTGCQIDTSRIKVLVTEDKNPPTATVPNIFSPNGDGVNDYLEFTVTHYTDLHLTVFNRWGNLVFESYSRTNQWDGKQHSVICPDGTYFYLLSVKNKSLEKVFKGYVEVVR